MTHFHHHMNSPKPRGPKDSRHSKKSDCQSSLTRITPLLAKAGVSPKQMKSLWKEAMKELSPCFGMTHPLNDQILFKLSSEVIEEPAESCEEELPPPPPMGENFDWRKVLVHLDRKDILPPGGILEVFKYYLGNSDFKLDTTLNKNDVQALRDHLQKIN